jgi:hypothetical protein
MCEKLLFSASYHTISTWEHDLIRSFVRRWKVISSSLSPNTMVRRPRAVVSSLRPSAAKRTPKNDAESFTDPCTQHQHCNRNLLPEHSAIAYQSRHLAARTPEAERETKEQHAVLAGKRRTAPLTSLRAERAEGRKDVAAWSAMSSRERKRLPRGRVDGTSCEQPED